MNIHDRLLHHVRRIQPRKVLDLGCGAGDLCAALIAEGIDVVGLEPTKEMCVIAQERCGASRIIRSSCYDEPAIGHRGLFDLVIASEVIEHLYQPAVLVSYAAQVLAPGGRLLLSTPDYGHYWRNVFLSIFDRWDRHHSPLWEGGHIKFFSKRTLQTLLENCRLRVIGWDTVRSRRAPIFPMSMIVIATHA